MTNRQLNLPNLIEICIVLCGEAILTIHSRLTNDPSYVWCVCLILVHHKHVGKTKCCALDFPKAGDIVEISFATAKTFNIFGCLHQPSSRPKSSCNHVWEATIGWDDSLPESTHQEWIIIWRPEMPLLTKSTSHVAIARNTSKSRPLSSMVSPMPRKMQCWCSVYVCVRIGLERCIPHWFLPRSKLLP